MQELTHFSGRKVMDLNFSNSFLTLKLFVSFVCMCGYSNHWGKDIERESFSVPAGTGTLNINHIEFENGPLVLSSS